MIANERMVLAQNFKEGIEMFESEPNLAIYWSDTSVSEAVEDICSIAPIKKITQKEPLTNYFVKNWTYGPLLDYQ